MDYLRFLDEFDTYNEWNRVERKNNKDDLDLDREVRQTFPPFQSNIRSIRPLESPDTIVFGAAKR